MGLRDNDHVNPGEHRGLVPRFRWMPGGRRGASGHRAGAELSDSLPLPFNPTQNRARGTTPSSPFWCRGSTGPETHLHMGRPKLDSMETACSKTLLWLLGPLFACSQRVFAGRPLRIGLKSRLFGQVSEMKSGAPARAEAKPDPLPERAGRWPSAGHKSVLVLFRT